MAKRSQTPLRIGLLGGGQLARMLALRAHEMGLEVHVLSASSFDPAAQVARYHHIGDPDREADIKSFLSLVDVATFESEFLDSTLLSKVAAEVGTQVAPRPVLMGLIQDRLLQKQLLRSHKLPTAEFLPVASVKDAELALTKFGGRYVLKQRRFGYDGYGTFIIDGPHSIKLHAARIEESNGFIAEEFIPFKRELAVMIARNASSEIVALPLVETFQENSRCLWVKGPIAHKKANPLIKKISKFLENIDYQGIMGIELFETKSGLMINELAPRVHNSGHYSMDALFEDQFTVHLKAVLNLPFSRVEKLAPGFAMLNLLGSPKVSTKSEWLLPKDVKLHWYGKTENRAGRKMGHLNAIDKNSKAALTKLLKARNAFKV